MFLCRGKEGVEVGIKVPKGGENNYEKKTQQNSTGNTVSPPPFTQKINKNTTLRTATQCIQSFSILLRFGVS